MKNRILTEGKIVGFLSFLREEERSENTREKYRRDIAAFYEYAGEGPITKESVIAYKQSLFDMGYKVRSINSKLAVLNSLWKFLGWHELRVKAVKMQREIFRPTERELSRGEYEKLCSTARAKNKERLCLILQTICGTGIRVSELEFITVEALKMGEATVSLKGKTRSVFIVKALREKLLRFCRGRGIKSGAVFVTKSGKPVSRTNIWREMKALCSDAGVNPSKVFPHNLRHLFARVFYRAQKDIAKLADILGHSSIETTRIYIIGTGIEHRRRMESLHLII